MFSKTLSFLLLFLPFSSLGLVQFDFDGFLRVRAGSPQIHDKNRDYLFEETFDLTGIVRANEKLQVQGSIISSSKVLPSFKPSIKFYGYLKWFMSNEIYLLVGKIPYETSFNQVVSSNEYEFYPYFFHGLLLNYSTTLINLDLWAFMLPSRFVSEVEVTDRDYGAGLSLDIYSVSDFLSHVNLHLIFSSNTFLDRSLSVFNGDDLKKTTTHRKDKKTTRYGLAIKGHLNNLDYRLVGMAHGNGFGFKSDESMYDIELAYSKVNFYGSRLFVGYHSDTKNYDAWFYDRHNNGGLLDLFLWGNLNYFYVGYEASFTNLFDFEMAFYHMIAGDEGGVSLGRYGSFLSPLFSKEESSSLHLNADRGFLGRELDFVLTKEVNKRVEVNLLLGVFLASSSLREKEGVDRYYSNIQITSKYQF